MGECAKIKKQCLIKIFNTYGFLDLVPDDSGHLISVQITDWVGDFDFGSEGSSCEGLSVDVVRHSRKHL